MLESAANPTVCDCVEKGRGAKELQILRSGASPEAEEEDATLFMAPARARRKAAS